MATTKQALTPQEIGDFLNAWREAYEKGDPAFFDFFATDATLFPISSPTRIDSIEEYRRIFETQLTKGVQRRVQIMSPEIRIMGNVAQVSCHNRIVVNGQNMNLRASFVIQQEDDGRLKVTHLHYSPMAVPTVPTASAVAVKSLEEITLLEERVATAAATVGTPK